VPPGTQELQLRVSIEHLAAGLPVNGFDPVVFDGERVSFGNLIDHLPRTFFVVFGHRHPSVFEGVGQLSEEIADRSKPLRQHLMNAVFDRPSIAQVIDEDGVADLADALDPAFPLFESCWVPRQVQVDQRAEPLQIQSLRRCIGADDEPHLVRTHALLDDLAVQPREVAFSEYA